MFKKLYILPLLMLLLTGCIYDDPKSEEMCEPMVSFNVTLSTEGSRVGDDDEGPKWGENYDDEDGFEWDQTISLSADSIHPVLYDVNAQGELVTTNVAGEIKNVTVTKIDNTNYKISGRLETTRTLGVLQNSNYRLVIFANMKDYDAANPMSTKAEFTRHGTPGQDGFNHIPMYGVGVAKLDHIGSVDGQTTYAIKDASGADLTIPMLRAMAKVRVNIADAIKDEIDLYSISINRHAKSGYIVPRFWNTVESVKEIKLSQTMNAKTQNNHDCHTVVTPESDNTNNENKLRFFVPDTYNADHDGVQGTTDIVLSVTYYYKGTDPSVETNRFTKPIYFQDYEGGKPAENGNRYDIIRNHVYDFTITKVTPAFGLEVEVDFKPWTYRKIVTEL